VRVHSPGMVLCAHACVFGTKGKYLTHLNKKVLDKAIDRCYIVAEPREAPRGSGESGESGESIESVKGRKYTVRGGRFTEYRTDHGTCCLPRPNNVRLNGSTVQRTAARHSPWLTNDHLQQQPFVACEQGQQAAPQDLDLPIRCKQTR
jgi:hypothetical protein